jgi:hypothetical protein
MHPTIAGGESCTEETFWLAPVKEQPDELARTGASAAVTARGADPPPKISAAAPPITIAPSTKTDKTPTGVDQ